MSRPNPNQGIERVPRFLRPWERAEMEKTARDFQKAADSPYLKDASHKAQLLRARDRALRDIETQTAPKLSQTEEDRAAKRSKELEERIKEGMLSNEEMRRNPVGAVDHHIRWERRNKKNIKEWKALQIALHPGADSSDTQDLCNIERLRALRNPNRNYDDAQIPPSTVFSMPPQWIGEKAGWPYITDDCPERLIESEREARLALQRELDELRGQIESKNQDDSKGDKKNPQNGGKRQPWTRREN